MGALDFFGKLTEFGYSIVPKDTTSTGKYAAEVQRQVKTGRTTYAKQYLADVKLGAAGTGIAAASLTAPLAISSGAGTAAGAGATTGSLSAAGATAGAGKLITAAGGTSLGRAALLAGGGALFGFLLRGGGGIKQAQDADQTTVTKPTQDTTQDADQTGEYKGTFDDTKTDQYSGIDTTVIPNIGAGAWTLGDIGGNLTYAPVTITQTGISQEAFAGILSQFLQYQQQQATPTQTVTVIPSQELSQAATQMDSSLLLIVAAIAGIALLGGRNGK